MPPLLLIFLAFQFYILPPPSYSNLIDKSLVEAAFQGKCGRESPCQQLCYELHDGMFECDCKEGFVLHQDGYSCMEVNRTGEDGGEEEAWTELGVPAVQPAQTPGERGEDLLYEKGAWFEAQLLPGSYSSSQPPEVEEGSTIPPVQPNRTPSSQCTTGSVCKQVGGETEVVTPRFSGEGWLAFPALKAAYKHVQLQMEFLPQDTEGILFLTGERDDLVGDFMALLIHGGFVEFRFDCGSGVGVVRSQETVRLNEWNRITLYRHRWDAWIQLNDGSHVQGRSKGLFSRMTFREPVFIGGRGNTSGLQDKLPTDHGLKGCVRHLQINDYIYKFSSEPKGDAVKGYNIDECIVDGCSKVPCQHGGRCLTSSGSPLCLCPLGFTGDLCETRLDLQVPAFNGSSYLRYPGLASSALSWLDIVITLKPVSKTGLIFYNGHRSDGMGDFIALYIIDGHFEFAFDLGTGAAIVRSSEPVSLGEWHEVYISRTGRLAVLQVDKGSEAQILSPGAFTQLFLPLSLYIGGIPNFGMVSPKVKVQTSFIGCIQKVAINNKPLQILADAVAGVNVDNCRHPCVTKPCGEVATCIPHHDAYKCVCDANCEESNEVETHHVASFTGTTFLHYTDPEILSRILGKKMAINLRLRTTFGYGLVLWTGGREVGTYEESRATSKDYLALAVHDGYIQFRFNLGSGESLIIYNYTKIDDGNWHRVQASRNEQEGRLSVDHGVVISKQSPGKLSQLNSNTGLYIGGLEDLEVVTHYKYNKGFAGCISELSLNLDYHVRLPWSSEAADHCGNSPP